MKKILDYRKATNFINVRGKDIAVDSNVGTADDIRRIAGIKSGRQIALQGRNGDMQALDEGRIYTIPKGSKVKDAPGVRKASDEVSNKGILLLDYDSFKEASNNLDIELDCASTKEFIENLNSDTSMTSYAYLGINPKLEHVRDKEIDSLWKDKFIVRAVKMVEHGIHMFNDVTQAMTLDVMKCVYENNVKKVVIISNSERLIDLVVLLREKNVNVDVVHYGRYTNYELSIKANGFIDLEAFIRDEEIEDEDINDIESESIIETNDTEEDE